MPLTPAGQRFRLALPRGEWHPVNTLAFGPVTLHLAWTQHVPAKGRRVNSRCLELDT